MSQKMVRITLEKIQGEGGCKRMVVTLAAPPFPKKNAEITFLGAKWRVTKAVETRGVVIRKGATARA